MLYTNDGHWPLVIVTFEGALTDEEYANYLAEHSEALRRRERYLTIVDVSKVTAPPPSFAMMQHEWSEYHGRELAYYLAGTAFVAPTLKLRSLQHIAIAISTDTGMVCQTMGVAMMWAALRMQTVRPRMMS